MIGALLGLAAAAAQLPITPPRLFRNWYAACDNGGACEAVALAPQDWPDNATPMWSLSIARDSRSSATRIVLQKEYDPSVPTTLRIDGKATGVSFSRTGVMSAGDAASAARLIASAHSIDLVDRSGKVVAHLSPDGAAAALHWVDEQQSHFPPGGGPLPTIAVPARSSAPPAKLSRQRFAAIRKAHDCSEVPPSWTPEFHRLDASATVGLIPCSLAAYQGDGLVLILDNHGKDRAAPFDPAWRRDPQEAPDPPNDLVDPEWDASSFALRTSWKDVGSAGCGGQEAYVWDGKRFRLAYEALMEQCRNSLELLPIWRTTNVRSAAR